MLNRPLPCPRKGCRGGRARDKLVCPACWRSIPLALRSEIWRTWGLYQRGEPGGYLLWHKARERAMETLQ